jgi:hypothetical protein
MNAEELASLRQRCEADDPVSVQQACELLDVYAVALRETLFDVDCAFGYLSSDHNRAKSFMYKAMTRLRKLLKD